MLISMSTLFIYTTVSSLPLYIYIYIRVCVCTCLLFSINYCSLGLYEYDEYTLFPQLYFLHAY